MQTLDIQRPGMPDLQFTLLVTALCTSRLTALNIPDALRTTIFDRCWVLVHDSPPPRRPEERVLDLRPWTDVTLDAMVETIRRVLTEAGIQTLTWDHAPSDATQHSTPAVQPLIDRFEQLYPQPSHTSEAFSGEVVGEVGSHESGPEMHPLVERIAAVLAEFPQAMEHRAAGLAASGHDPDVVARLLKGAEAMRDSGSMYLTWARHYDALSEGRPEGVDEADERPDF